MTDATPKVFISYSHDTVEHQERVLDFADRLRAGGVDAEIDQYNAAPPEGWPLWCERQIAAADFVLMVCTETYHRRVKGDEEQGKGLGVVWEARIIRQLLYDAGAVSDKFVPVLFSDASPEQIPTPIKGWSRYVIDTEDGYENLYRRLTAQPRLLRPALGPIRPLPTRERQWSEGTMNLLNRGQAMTQIPQVFLAHAHEDKAAVRKLYDDLTERGYKLWLDEVDLTAGQNWKIEIPNAIRASGAILALFSSISVSKKGYIQNEFRLALAEYARRPPQSIWLIPVLLDECIMPDLQIPDLGASLADIQWVSLYQKDGFDKLLRAIEQATGVPPKALPKGRNAPNKGIPKIVQRRGSKRGTSRLADEWLRHGKDAPEAYKAHGVQALARCYGSQALQRQSFLNFVVNQLLDPWAGRNKVTMSNHITQLHLRNPTEEEARVFPGKDMLVLDESRSCNYVISDTSAPMTLRLRQAFVQTVTESRCNDFLKHYLMTCVLDGNVKFDLSAALTRLGADILERLQQSSGVYADGPFTLEYRNWNITASYVEDVTLTQESTWVEMRERGYLDPVVDDHYTLTLPRPTHGVKLTIHIEPSTGYVLQQYRFGLDEYHSPGVLCNPIQPIGKNETIAFRFEDWVLPGICVFLMWSKKTE